MIIFKKNLSFLIFFFLLSKINYLSSLDTATIHVFGDSNALHCFTHPVVEIPNQTVYKNKEIFTHKEYQLTIPAIINAFIGKTMYGASKDGFLKIKDHNIKENEAVVFIFGCVDVYYHIAQQRDEKFRELNEILDSLVDNYIRSIIQNRNDYTKLCCVVVSVLPPYIEIHGNLTDKINITFNLNKKLHQACTKNNIEYLDIHSIYATEQGYLNPLLGNTHHVNSAHNYPIQKKLIEVLIEHHFPIHIESATSLDSSKY